MGKSCMIIGVFLAFLLFAGIPCLAQCEGDLNCDGDIDGSDLAVFAMNFGSTGCPDECFAVTRGFVESNGAIGAGEGFSVSYSNLKYTITFDSPPPDFTSNIPTVIVTPYNTNSPTACYSTVSGFTANGEFEVYIWDYGGKQMQSAFSFILILPQ